MHELPLVFVAGLLGSAHCIGMCGPFALIVGSQAANWKSNLGRQSVYTLGRVFTYSVLGAIAGAAGLYVQENLSTIVNAAAVLAMIAGGFLIYQGLAAAQVFTRRSTGPTKAGCFAREFFSSFLKAPGLQNLFLAGLFTGLLPCGLVYGFLALAAATRSPILGASLMAIFGLGTAPIMMLTGCGGSLLGLIGRKRVFQFAAWCVVLTGVISIARGAGYLHFPGVTDPAGCPFCETPS